VVRCTNGSRKVPGERKPVIRGGDDDDDDDMQEMRQQHSTEVKFM
jgi:hypothetical protein